ncbi:MAG: biotin transporter BioY [Planctomycetota bacterium]|nr:biotin transporter BioY [Planctomycetota bacterium]
MINRRMAMDGMERGEGDGAFTGGLLRAAMGVAAMASGLAVGAQVEVWMEPVPMTLQTFALVVGAALLGPGLGAAAAALYVALAAMGVPVLAGWRALPGAAILDSPSTGYLVGFVAAAALAGLARRRLAGGVLSMTLLFAAAHLIVLGLGAAALARDMGLVAALERGAAPYLLGGAVKSFAAAALVAGLRGRPAARPRTP